MRTGSIRSIKSRLWLKKDAEETREDSVPLPEHLHKQEKSKNYWGILLHSRCKKIHPSILCSHSSWTSFAVAALPNHLSCDKSQSKIFCTDWDCIHVFWSLLLSFCPDLPQKQKHFQQGKKKGNCKKSIFRKNVAWCYSPYSATGIPCGVSHNSQSGRG